MTTYFHSVHVYLLKILREYVDMTPRVDTNRSEEKTLGRERQKVLSIPLKPTASLL